MAHLPPPPDREAPPPDREAPPPDREAPPPDREAPPPDREAPPPDRKRPQSANVERRTGTCRVGAVEPPRSSKFHVSPGLWKISDVTPGGGDAEVARVVELQRGIVSHDQLLAAGITPSGIKHRVRAGRLHRLHPGVYLVGRPRLEPLGAATAAVLYLDGCAVLSHRTAGLVWELVSGPERPVTLTASTGVRCGLAGLVLHRSQTLTGADVRCRHRLPVTSPARTLLDLAGVLDAHELEAAYASAARRGLVDAGEVRVVIERASRSRGRALLRQLAATSPVRDGVGSPARSGYERKLLALIRTAQLPEPLVNAVVGESEVDLLWPQQRLVVEFDGFAYHSDRRAFERDRLRDQRLAAAGYRVIRITARQLDATPEAVVARLAAALALAGQ